VDDRARASEGAQRRFPVRSRTVILREVRSSRTPPGGSPPPPVTWSAPPAGRTPGRRGARSRARRRA